MTIACDIDTPPHKHSEQQTNKKKIPLTQFKMDLLKLIRTQIIEISKKWTQLKKKKYQEAKEAAISAFLIKKRKERRKIKKTELKTVELIFSERYGVANQWAKAFSQGEW